HKAIASGGGGGGCPSDSVTGWSGGGGVSSLSSLVVNYEPGQGGTDSEEGAGSSQAFGSGGEGAWAANVSGQPGDSGVIVIIPIR
ncbi:MAG: hypothetical protein ACRDZP_09875, partial [Acidimicrobiales bacterium]